MPRIFNRVRMSTSTTGTGTITLGSAVTGYATFAEAGVTNGEVVTYTIEDGDDFEIGFGTYTSSGTTMSRDTVLLSKISGASGTSKKSLSGSAEVFITAAAQDLHRQRSIGSYASNANITTAIPGDDTIPQITEGTEIMTASITPSSSSNRVRITVTLWGGVGASCCASPRSGAALFRDAVSNALQAFATGHSGAGTAILWSLTFQYEDAPATTSAITYRVRVGPVQVGTIRLNGLSTGRLFGGASTCLIVVEEIAP